MKRSIEIEVEMISNSQKSKIFKIKEIELKMQINYFLRKATELVKLQNDTSLNLGDLKNKYNS